MKVWWAGLLVVAGIVFVMAGATGNANRLFIGLTGKDPMGYLGLAKTTTPTAAPGSTAGTPALGSYPQHPSTAAPHPGLVSV